MQQPEYRNNVQTTSGIGEEVEFDVEINETIFQMLSSDVYNDPPLAVMREWSTNACDACLAAGLPVLYDVHLPTAENPVFYVRDYGTGLSLDDVKTLFSTLGKSTKRNSDALNGCLGIGRMAGLAVSDAFTVESYYEGTHYSFVVSMKKGRPVILPLSEIPTDQPNGLKLSVSVPMDDMANFQKRAQNLYRYFDYKPSINLDIDLTFDSGNREWFISEDLGSDNYVLMSQVLYKIPTVPEIETFGFRSIVMRAPPGAVTFNPGRESLSLNQRTIEYVNSMFVKTSEDFIDKAKEDFGKCSNDKDIHLTYQSIIASCPYKLKKNIDPIPYLSKYGQALVGINYSGNLDPDAICISQSFATLTNYLMVPSYKYAYHKYAKKTNNYSATTFYRNPHIIIDKKTGFKTQLNEHFHNKSYIAWSRNHGTELDDFVEEAKKTLTALGIPYKLLSEEVPLNTVTKTTTPRDGLYASGVIGDTVSRSEKMSESEITDTTWLYLKVSGSKPLLSDDNVSFSDYQKVYKCIRACDSNTPAIRAVPKKYQSFVEGLDNWVDYETYIKDKLKTLKLTAPMKVEYPPLCRIIGNANIGKFTKPIQDCYRELENYKRVTKLKGFVTSDIEELIVRMGGTVEPYTPDNENFYTNVKENYPLTLQLLTGKVSLWGNSEKFTFDIMHLEDSCAVHSTD